MLLVFVVTLSLLVSCNNQPPYVKGNGEPIHLVNNDGASDHTWDEVASFLLQDKTDRGVYSTRHNSFNFAEELHNKAEYYGFKTALVIVDFENGETYCLNAFDTIDLGLVYVDSTGRDNFSSIRAGMSATAEIIVE